MAVGTASDYAALLKEYQAKQAGVKKWEDIFLQPYQTAAEQVSTQTQYDISGAFAQYKKSQLSAMQNMQLGTGFKEQIASDLASQYGSAYSQLRQEEASQLGELQTSYLQTLAQQEEALTEQGERFAEIEGALYDYMGITDTSLLEQAYGADGGLGFFEMTEPGSYKITERGIDAFDKALNDYYNATEKDRGQLFTDYLAEQNPELLDWYKQNSGLVRELVGGIERGDVSYSEEDVLESENLQIQSDYSNYIDSTKIKGDVEEQNKYLTAVKNAVDAKNEFISSYDDLKSKNRNKTFAKLLNDTIGPVTFKSKGSFGVWDSVEVNFTGSSNQPYDKTTISIDSDKADLDKETISKLKEYGFKKDKYGRYSFNGTKNDVKNLAEKLVKGV